jgi:hypothetical protein
MGFVRCCLPAFREATEWRQVWIISGAVPHRAAAQFRPSNPLTFKSMWAMQREIQAVHPGKQLMIGVESYKQACGPEADVRAVYERVSHLWILQEVGVLASWVHDGVPDDAVFYVAAKIPMSRMQRGVVYRNPPFDVAEFIKQVEKRTQS